ncbi:MAG: T9SS type A sorting domain-containing protein [Flavobacteriaceae bacterium]|nr:T9SS type A sorting domain-containing protein [Flavobacteriaceae bacterium]
MKKITLLLLLFLVSFSAKAQFPEDFESSVPPSGWTSFIGTNGEGTGQDWQATTAAGTFVSGAQAAYVRYESVANSAEDWLVTPQFTPSAAANILSFQQRQAFGIDYGTIYTIRVSTASQTAHADFTIVDTQSETDFGGIFNIHYVDLSAYDGVPIYVAFVMEQNDGDSWYIDDVDLIPNASAPACAENPTPANAATGVVVTSGNVTISWDGPSTGDAATGYEIFWGTTSGSLTSLGSISATTVDITNVDLSTTYYWMVVPSNVGGSATGCAEWSFTTEDPPPAPANDLPAGAIALTVDQGLACGANGITGISNQSTTDSGVTAPSCGSYGTPTERGDLWYTVVAPSTGELTLDTNNVTTTSIAGAFYSGTVGALVEESCTEFGSGWPWTITGLTAGETYYVRVWDYGNDQTGTFDLCAFYPAPIVPNYTNDFSTYPGDGWTEASGVFMTPTGASSSFTSDDFANDSGHANGQSARINIFGSLTDEYLISPAFDLSGNTYYLNFEIAYTAFSTTAAATLGADDYVALIVTEDGGTSWTELTRWDSGSTISNTGESATEIVLAGYGADVKFAFYAFSDTSNEDNNFYIDNFQVSTTTLGVEDNRIAGFSLFPTIVKQDLNFTAQSNVEQIDIFNLLGQRVFSSQPNITNSHVDLSALKAGIYIVKVRVAGAIGTYKIIKE